MLYELTVGIRPFLEAPHEEHAVVMARAGDKRYIESVVLADERCAHLSRKLRDLLARMFAVDPEQRLTMCEVRALREWFICVGQHGGQRPGCQL